MVLKHRGASIRVVLALAAVALAGLAALGPVGDEATGWDSGVAGLRGRGGKPHALAGRLEELERLRRALPGDQGMASGGPGAFDEEKFLNQAYPDSDIPIDRIQGARLAFAAAQSRGVGQGRNSTTQWYSLGPTSAVYQETFLRRGYVPSRYVSSGRVTSMAIGPSCSGNACRVWVAAAGGGVWRTDNALQGTPHWTYLTGSIGINAVGAISLDPSDPSGNTVWIGTGEANASADSAAGVGLYRSTDGGQSWTGPIGSAQFKGRAVGSIAVDPTHPDTLYVGTTRGVRGVASVNGGGVSLIPGAALWGLYKSSDGGATWAYVHNGAAAVCPDASPNFVNTASNLTACSPRGVRRVLLDPSDPQTVYAASYARGVWRSNDGGATWTEIKPSLASTNANMRPDIAVAALAGGKTRMYVGEGGTGSPSARLFRSDDVASGAPVFTNLTSSSPASPGFGSFNYCTGQCWYDNFVVTPPGHPDVVYVGGSHQYGEANRISNGRGVVLSTDAGVSWSDMTEDSVSGWAPNGLHPDHHALVTNPGNPFQFFEGSDGGVMRSSGTFANTSGRCDDRGLAEPSLSRCRQLLARVPTRLDSLNKGINTLQFQSLSVSPHNPRNIQGGTQDNGTFETSGSAVVWNQTMWGDGGQSGFDAADRTFRFHTFFSATPDVNFSNGAIHDWNWIGDRIYAIEPQSFYIPMISDPVVPETLYAGLAHVWRTKTHGKGTLSVGELRDRCNEFRGDFTIFCGDWEPLGAVGYVPPPPYQVNPSPGTRLTAAGALYGTDRSGGVVAAVERAPGDSSTLWAATSAGRVFVSKNADADPASAVVFRRIDPLSAADPGRFVSGIHVDPANANHAWISYSGFSAATPANPGHVFEVTYNPSTNAAAWSSLDFDLGDLPLNDVARDDQTGEIFVASDFGVLSLAGASWVPAAAGMPAGEVAGLTIIPSARKLYAATHGLGAWSLTLP